jgi:hypothetical protein
VSEIRDVRSWLGYFERLPLSAFESKRVPSADMHSPLPQVFVYPLFFDANMQAMNDPVATSFHNSYSPPLETGGIAAFLPASIFFALCIRKDPL